MMFLKKLFLGLAAITLIFVGGSGTQSTSVLMQGGGLVGLILGLVVLYIFGKLVWRAMGCLPSLLIIVGIVGFILYAIGAFDGGVQNVIPNLQKFIGAGKTQTGMMNENPRAIQLENAPSTPVLGENFSDIKLSEINIEPQQVPAPIMNKEIIPEPANIGEAPQEPTAQQQVMQPQQQVPIAPQQAPIREPERESGGVMGFVNSLLGGGNNSQPVSQPQNFNPSDYPAVYGSVQVINGDTLNMRNHFIRLYGIDAPEKNQTCANAQGRSYACGREAARWLQGWIQDGELECHVLKQDSKGNVVATCAYGQYDLGAALVSAGWAVSLPNNSIYRPYEIQAQEARRGMWQGQFYKPWDWREIQSKKPKIKIIKPKTKKRLWDYM